MKVKIKLFANLQKYLPPGTADHEAELEVAEGATAMDVMARLDLPPEVCHLVLINGVFLEPRERGRHTLRDKDVLAMWPPIAGG